MAPIIAAPKPPEPEPVEPPRRPAYEPVEKDWPEPEGDMPGIAFIALSDAVCRFPLNDGWPWRFCGTPTKGKPPYCQKHRTLCFTPYHQRRTERLAWLR